MAEPLFNKPAKDKTPVWIQNKHGVKSCWPAHAAKKHLADRNKGFELCDPEFVPKKPLRPLDEGKTATAQKNANTEMTARQFEELTQKSFKELQEFAKEKEVSIQGLRSKKGILEKLEAEGKLY